jgi:hypothetical protein
MRSRGHGMELVLPQDDEGVNNNAVGVPFDKRVVKASSINLQTAMKANDILLSTQSHEEAD